ncbi:hypothetical protein ACWD7M_38185, partial [Streptomyces griseus]
MTDALVAFLRARLDEQLQKARFASSTVAITDRFRMPSCGDAGGPWNNPFSHGLRGMTPYGTGWGCAGPRTGLQHRLRAL